MTDLIELKGVNKYYGDYHALRDINLSIRAGEFFSLLGPSGCGKTTLLRTIAGFEDVSEGTLTIAGKSMKGVPANQRPTNMVFQSYAIFPHLSVGENVGFGLRRDPRSKDEKAKLIGEALEMVGLAGLGARAAHALSGGQRQRVALARALILKPKVLLLDEPLSALDKKMREQMQVELIKLQREVGITFILVTHDQEEALVMSDRIAVMFEGRIGQLGDPESLYRRPATRQVAGFIGMMNFLKGKAGAHVNRELTSDEAHSAPGLLDQLKRNLGVAEPAPKAIRQFESGVEVEVAGLGKAVIPADQIATGLHGKDCLVGIRPETLSIVFDGENPGGRVIDGVVDEVVYYGDMTYYQVRVAGVDEPMTISMKNLIGREVLEVGAKTRVAWDPRALVCLAP